MNYLSRIKNRLFNNDIPEEIEEPIIQDDVSIQIATQRQLIWRRFKRHRLGFASAIVVLLFYVLVLFADFFSTSLPIKYGAARGFMPPQGIEFFQEGHFMSVCQVNGERDMDTFLMVHTQDCSVRESLSLFGKGYEYKLELIQEILASKEMYLAKYYIEREKWIPAINRYKNVIEEYDTTIYVEEALHRLVEIHYKIGLIEESKKYASLLGYNYQSSEWYKESYKVFNKDYKKISKRKKEKNKLSTLDKIKSMLKNER